MNRKILATLALLSLGALPIGQALADPPDWAPARGYRAKHQYIYYPAHRIYYEPAQQNWFWYEDGKWSFGASLPIYYRQYTYGGVTVELDTDHPYERQVWVEERYGKPVKSKAEKSKPEKHKSKHGKEH